MRVLFIVVRKFKCFVGVKNERDLLFLSASAELGSEHPIAAAIAEYLQGKHSSCKPVEPKKFKIVPGKGISCVVQKKVVLVGNARLLQSKSVTIASKVSRCRKDL